MKNKIEDLRNHLFTALEGLSDQEKPMEIERARAIVDSAKAEVAFLAATGRRDGTGFIALPPEENTNRPRLAAANERW